MPALCPVAGKPGKRVPEATLRNLVRADRLGEVDHGEWFYCDLPDCDVVYFAADGRSLLKDDLEVRVGVKEKTSPRPVCYCFGHTVESIREEIEGTGRSTVAASITAKVKAGVCNCETMNPKGSCCLGDVAKVVKEAFAMCGAHRPGPAPTCAEERHDCCAGRSQEASADVGPSRVERAGLLAVGASVFSAILASACCWLPLLLVAFGTSAAGASAAFERVRPFFLARDRRTWPARMRARRTIRGIRHPPGVGIRMLCFARPSDAEHRDHLERRGQPVRPPSRIRPSAPRTHRPLREIGRAAPVASSCHSSPSSRACFRPRGIPGGSGSRRTALPGWRRR